MSKRKDTSLKALIQENPHWAIMWGTTLMALLVGVFLVVASQITLKDTISSELFIDVPEFATQAPENNLIATFPIQSSSIQIGRASTVRIIGNFGTYIGTNKISKIENKQGIVYIPLPLETSRGTKVDNIDCSVKAYIDIDNGDITLLGKLWNALKGSFRI